MKTSPKQYAQALYDLTENKSEQESLAVVIKFVKQLEKDGQMKAATEIMEKFSELYDTARGIITAKITSKVALDEELRNKLRNSIADRYGAKEVMIENVIDESVKGGIIIKVGDEVIDGSVSTQLKRLKKSMVDA